MWLTSCFCSSLKSYLTEKFSLVPEDIRDLVVRDDNAVRFKLRASDASRKVDAITEEVRKRKIFLWKLEPCFSSTRYLVSFLKLVYKYLRQTPKNSNWPRKKPRRLGLASQFTFGMITLFWFTRIFLSSEKNLIIFNNNIVDLSVNHFIDCTFFHSLIFNNELNLVSYISEVFDYECRF